MEIKMNNLIKLTVIILTMIMIYGCGKATIEPQNESYEPKIVIEGFLVAGQAADRVFITKNFTVDSDLNRYNLIPDPDLTEVFITDLSSGDIYNLSFHMQEKDIITEAYWRYEGMDFKIQAGNIYRIDVSADVNGKILSAYAQTTVPSEGFVVESLNHSALKYRQKDENGDLMTFAITYTRSPGTNFYVAAIQAKNPELSTYIYDNPYDGVQPEDVVLIDDAFNYEVDHHTQSTAGNSKMTLGWYDFRFYDEYEIIMYAADKNYKDFFITYREVMELDGNFHEAKFNIEGDGIGVFGSIIADTVSCRVVQ
jgi:hypothetical protein